MIRANRKRHSPSTKKCRGLVPTPAGLMRCPFRPGRSMRGFCGGHYEGALAQAEVNRRQNKQA